MNISLSLEHDIIGQKKLEKYLAMIIGGSNCYGKTIEKNLEATLNIFIFGLGEYTFPEIEAALKKYISHGKGGIPEVKDIQYIIESGIVYSEHIFIAISKKPEDKRSESEQIYYNKWLEYISKGCTNGMNTLDHEEGGNIPSYIKDGIVTKYGERAYTNWISKSLVHQETDNEVSLLVRSRFIREYIIANYLDYIKSLWKKEIIILVKNTNDISIK